MRGNPEVVELLNEVLTAELTAINQYFLDSRMCGNWGYGRAAKWFRDASVEEMRDAEALIDRVLFLDGVPNLQRLGPVGVGESVPEKLELALRVENDAITRLNQGVATCARHDDNGTRRLLEEMLAGEERHAEWLGSQLEILGQVGEQHYLALQIDS